MIEYRKGDVLDALRDRNVSIVAHGVNCRGGFGSGIAGQIAKRYPVVRSKYLEKFKNEGWRLGESQGVFMYDEPSRHLSVIMNCATQDDYGRDGQLYCDYDAIFTCITTLYNTCASLELTPGIPKIGCGLAGGDWIIVEKIINNIFKKRTIYVYEL